MTIRKVALVGAGQMGANHARTVFRSEQFELSFVVDADLGRAKTLAEQFGAIAVSGLTTLMMFKQLL